MLNLASMTLVPLKTMAKTRDGREAIFTYHTPGSDYWRFCCSDSDGTFVVRSHGKRYDNDSEEPNDIVAIATPWKPKIGDRVRIYGIAHKRQSTSETNICQGLDVYEVNTLPDEHGYMLVQRGANLVQRGANLWRINVRNLKREP